jgi:hypothetical protein
MHTVHTSGKIAVASEGDSKLVNRLPQATDHGKPRLRYRRVARQRTHPMGACRNGGARGRGGNLGRGGGGRRRGEAGGHSRKGASSGQGGARVTRALFTVIAIYHHYCYNSERPRRARDSEAWRARRARRRTAIRRRNGTGASARGREGRVGGAWGRRDMTPPRTVSSGGRAAAPTPQTWTPQPPAGPGRAGPVLTMRACS